MAALLTLAPEPGGAAALGAIGQGGRVADGDSFDDWFAVAWPRLVRLALANVRTLEEAEDAASDACMALLRRWESDRPADPTGWAIVVTANRARKLGPRLRRTFGGSGAAEAREGHADIDVDLLDAIRALPSRQRTAIALRYLADLTQAEVAAAMDVAPGTAAALLHQGRANLRDRLGER